MEQQIPKDILIEIFTHLSIAQLCVVKYISVLLMVYLNQNKKSM